MKAMQHSGHVVTAAEMQSRQSEHGSDVDGSLAGEKENGCAKSS
jgi:hypothetical protein